MAGDLYLVDTNILIRWVQHDSADFALVNAAMVQMVGSGAIPSYTSQSLGEFWQALGGKPKAALNYTVTLSVDVTEPERQPLVIDREIRMRLDTQPAS